MLFIVFQCAKLSEMGEECFVVTVNVANGWVGHMGSLRGDEFLDEKSHILYEFLNYCCGRCVIFLCFVLHNT